MEQESAPVDAYVAALGLALGAVDVTMVPAPSGRGVLADARELGAWRAAVDRGLVVVAHL